MKSFKKRIWNDTYWVTSNMVWTEWSDPLCGKVRTSVMGNSNRPPIEGQILEDISK